VAGYAGLILAPAVIGRVRQAQNECLDPLHLRDLGSKALTSRSRKPRFGNVGFRALQTRTHKYDGRAIERSQRV
jgi:hypothetical protein